MLLTSCLKDNKKDEKENTQMDSTNNYFAVHIQHFSGSFI